MTTSDEGSDENESKVATLAARLFELNNTEEFEGASRRQKAMQLLSLVEILGVIIHMDVKQDDGRQFLAGADVLPSFLVFVGRFTDAVTMLRAPRKLRRPLKRSATAFSGYVTYFLEYLVDCCPVDFADLVFSLGRYYYYTYVLNTDRRTEIADVLCAGPWNLIIEYSNEQSDKLVRLIQEKSATSTLNQRPRKRILPEHQRTVSTKTIGSKVARLGYDVYDIRVYDDHTYDIIGDLTIEEQTP